MPNCTIILFGLDEALEAELRSVLSGQDQAVYPQPSDDPHEFLERAEQMGAELVFCSADRPRYLELLDAVNRSRPGLPVVVVSRVPEVSEWLDAIEAGASDYCAAPFEAAHIEWILESNVKHRSAPAVYRAAS